MLRFHPSRGVVSALALMLAVGTSGAFAQSAATLPAAPTGLGQVDTAPVADVPAYVDTGVTNQRGDACTATAETNAGVRLLSGFLKVWTPRTPFVDADVDAEAKDGCAAVAKTDWDGMPGSATDGVVVDAALHAANIDYVIAATAARTDAQAIDAYLDDRRGKNASMVDGLGPLTDAWRSGAWQFTTINGVPADATSVKYEDHGNNVGVGSMVDDQPANDELGLSVDLLNLVGVDASTEPTKRFFKYARPWRWSMDVAVVPTLEAAKSGTPVKDGGFPSGHTAEAWRNGLTMAYLVPERYQEMLTRAYQLGDDRILAGMHSPLDVVGGRMLGTAAVVYNFNMESNGAIKADAYAQAQAWLMRQTGATSPEEL
ncbi:MAG: phosphatase PAP2 family protein, partial [Alphaproteobacteria bacterium]|nr:phosphatase PAP2 family protein [Alphaproteobacteria bacterium]